MKRPGNEGPGRGRRPTEEVHIQCLGNFPMIWRLHEEPQGYGGTSGVNVIGVGWRIEWWFPGHTCFIQSECLLPSQGFWWMDARAAFYEDGGSRGELRPDFIERYGFKDVTVKTVALLNSSKFPKVS